MRFDGFSRFCWILLAYTVAVILWGAFVRATGSGAGCGSHWPTCNGEVIPRSPGAETLIEYTHRLTSGILGLLSLGLVAAAFRRFPKGSRVRAGAAGVLFFVVAEALVGAGIVKFEWVAGNDSVARVVTVAFHLTNTFLLLATLALTAWWASGGPAFSFRRRGWSGRLLALTLVGTALVGAAGAVTALGDTLVNNAGLRAQDSPVVAALVEARLYHPVSALFLGFLLGATLWTGIETGRDGRTQRLAWWASGLYGVQLVCGLVNVYLQAPVWMQLLHLLLADAFWISLVLLAASALALRQEARVAEPVAGEPVLQPNR